MLAKEGEELSSRYYTFEKLAAQYINYIIKIQPEGPYNLFGWSFGGVLAFEIARQLIIKGNKINHITMIDSYFNMEKVITKLKENHPEIPVSGMISVNNINYKYKPKDNVLTEDFNVVLFKATKVSNLQGFEEYNKEDMKVSKFIENYYLNKNNNHLDDFIESNSINIIKLQSGHNDWITSKEDIQLISNIVGSLQH